MIKNIIFDFGDVFVNLDKTATTKIFKDKGIESLPDYMKSTCINYEIGKHNTEKFINRFVDRYSSKFSNEEFRTAWNSILLDFPLYRLEFLKELAASKKYRLFLLSNTNDLHISWIQNDWGLQLYNEFKSCFEKFYLSHEIHLRKPNSDIYEFVLNENKLNAEETFFIDDTKENTDAASALGIKVWNINPETEDVVILLAKKEFNR
ncbi:MAG: HAD family phosphatase [Flavobacteriaceae bacterium]|nr:HAD family phosphatase [Flavobacteriaceae bacterium]